MKIQLGILKFLKFRIPYGDPPKGLGDDIIVNSRIPKKRHPLTPRKTRIPKDKFRIPSINLKFPRINSKIPYRDPRVKLENDREFHIEIPPPKKKGGDDIVGNSRIP